MFLPSLSGQSAITSSTPGELLYIFQDPTVAQTQGILMRGIVNSEDAVCDQKTSKFFVSHREESMEGHLGVMRVY
jgi:hypothetical protein